GLELLGTLLFGAGIGYATGLSPFVVCALAAAAIVNASPRRRQVQALLAAWEQPGYALLLILVGALLTLPTLWILVAVAQLAAPPLLGLVLRPTPAPLTPAPASPEFTPNAPAD